MTAPTLHPVGTPVTVLAYGKPTEAVVIGHDATGGHRVRTRRKYTLTVPEVTVRPAVLVPVAWRRSSGQYTLTPPTTVHEMVEDGVETLCGTPVPRDARPSAPPTQWPAAWDVDTDDAREWHQHDRERKVCQRCAKARLALTGATTATCGACKADLEHEPAAGWVDALSGDLGGTYDKCPEVVRPDGSYGKHRAE